LDCIQKHKFQGVIKIKGDDDKPSLIKLNINHDVIDHPSPMMIASDDSLLAVRCHANRPVHVCAPKILWSSK